MRAQSFIVCCVLTTQPVLGQDLGSWNILNIKYTLTTKWNLTGESQVRSLAFYNNFHYYEVSGTVNYQPNPNIRWTLGGGSYQTYAEGGDFKTPKNQEEYRLWPQVTLLHALRKVNAEHRYRAEMRFTDKGYRNRYRYRFGITVPAGKIKKDFRPLQFLGSNEIFFTDKEPYFERVRVVTAVNFRFSKTSAIQVGYLYQFDYKLTDEIGRDFLIVGFYYEFVRNTAQHSRTVSH